MRAATRAKMSNTGAAMLLLAETPGREADFAFLYEAQAREGLVHSALMRGDRFDMVEEFNEEWASPAITWSAGGEEHYHLRDSGCVKLRSAGALTLAADARYAYAASPETVFRSNMISFPQWMEREARRDVIDVDKECSRHLKTRLFSPDGATQKIMNTLAARCASGFTDINWYTEQAALLYERLVNEQDRRAASENAVNASKPATREELARRVDRAQQFMLERYYDSAIDLNAIARAACLSPYHLIRVFKALTGATPMRRLAEIRTEAGMRLLRHTKKSTAEIAAAVGYSDRTAFFKSFKTHFGVAPSEAARVGD